MPSSIPEIGSVLGGFTEGGFGAFDKITRQRLTKEKMKQVAQQNAIMNELRMLGLIMDVEQYRKAQEADLFNTYYKLQQDEQARLTKEKEAKAKERRFEETHYRTPEGKAITPSEQRLRQPEEEKPPMTAKDMESAINAERDDLFKALWADMDEDDPKATIAELWQKADRIVRRKYEGLYGEKPKGVAPPEGATFQSMGMDLSPTAPQSPYVGQAPPSTTGVTPAQDWIANMPRGEGMGMGKAGQLVRGQGQQGKPTPEDIQQAIAKAQAMLDSGEMTPEDFQAFIAQLK